jgi:hypothetical protein
MKCRECRFSAKTKSKIYAGRCLKYGTYWLDNLNGCLDGEPKEKQLKK